MIAVDYSNGLDELVRNTKLTTDIHHVEQV